MGIDVWCYTLRQISSTPKSQSSDQLFLEVVMAVFNIAGREVHVDTYKTWFYRLSGNSRESKSRSIRKRIGGASGFAPRRIMPT